MFVAALFSVAFAANHPRYVLVKEPQPGQWQAGDRLAGELTLERALRVPGWWIGRSPDPALAVAALQAAGLVAETDAEVTLEDEPDLPLQWQLENLPSRRGTFDVDTDATDAWAQGARGQGVLVAIIDTGVNIYHPQLAGRIWTNPDEIEDNGLDDDNNGVIDDVHGYDATEQDGTPTDTDGHGTACAGLVAARADGLSAVGLAPEATILPIKIFGGDAGFSHTAAEGIVYAAGEGAQVLSNSWTHGRAPSAVVEDALAFAKERGALFVASAGNRPVDFAEGGFYPAAYDDDIVVSVAAHVRHGPLVYQPGLWGSAFGQGVDLSAPGEGTWTLHSDGGAGDFAGTSAAAPLVAATAALVWSVEPELDAVAVKEILKSSVWVDGSDTESQGRLDAAAAVRLALTGDGPLPAKISAPRHVDIGEPERFFTGGPPGTTARWYFPDDQTFHDGLVADHTFMVPGEWPVVVEIVDPSGNRGRAEHLVSIPIPWQPLDGESVESAHGVRQQGGVWAPEGLGDAVWVRFHFEALDVRSTGFDVYDAFVQIDDDEGLWLWSFAGQAEDLWTPPLPAQGAKITWWISEDQRPDEDYSEGFTLDAVEVWRPGDPLTAPEPESPASPAVERGACGCGLGQDPVSLALAASVGGLIWRRRRRAGPR